MRITTKGRYGLRAMVELADLYGNGPVLMSQIANRLGVSRKYLHALLTALRAANLVRSIRGSGGGYCLAKAPAQITIDQILEALEGSQALVDCLHDPSVCDRSPTCVTHEVWGELQQVIKAHLAAITLQDLSERSAALRAAHQTHGS